jgi:hypothetical protein
VNGHDDERLRLLADKFHEGGTDFGLRAGWNDLKPEPDDAGTSCTAPTVFGLTSMLDACAIIQASARWPIIFSIMRVPNPRCVGGVTVGPPDSTLHSVVTCRVKSGDGFPLRAHTAATIPLGVTKQLAVAPAFDAIN